MVCPFNNLYWHFLDRHRKLLAQNPCMGTMYRVLGRMDQEERQKIMRQVDDNLKALMNL